MRNIGTLMLGSLRETLRDRLLLGLLVSGALVMLALVALAPMTLGARDKTFNDFGLAWIHASGFLILVVLGAWTLHRERERGILLTVLTRPVARYEYLCGRFCGLLGMLAVMLIASGLLYALIAAAAGIGPVHGLPLALLYIFLEMSLLAGLVLLFSNVSGFAMTVFLAIAVFFAGHLAGDMIRMAQLTENGLVNAAAQGAHWLLPHMEIYRVRADLVSGLTPSAADLGRALLYTSLYLAGLVFASVLVFNRKELR